MPFKSEAQRRKFEVMLKEGKITQEKFNEFEQATPANIPDRVHPKKPADPFNPPRSVDDIQTIFKNKYGDKK